MSIDVIEIENIVDKPEWIHLTNGQFDEDLHRYWNHRWNWKRNSTNASFETLVSSLMTTLLNRLINCAFDISGEINKTMAAIQMDIFKQWVTSLLTLDQIFQTDKKSFAFHSLIFNDKNFFFHTKILFLIWENHCQFVWRILSKVLFLKDLYTHMATKATSVADGCLHWSPKSTLFLLSQISIFITNDIQLDYFLGVLMIMTVISMSFGHKRSKTGVLSKWNIKW